MSSNALEELYREVVLEHHRNPLGRDPLDRVDALAEGHSSRKQLR